MPSIEAVRPRVRTMTVVVCALLVVVAWSLRPEPADSVIATSQRVGTLRLTGISTSVLPIRSFALEATAVSGGGGGGAPTFGKPVVGIDAAGVSPAILRALATGAHLPKLTVVLYREGTSTRFQEWEFTDTSFTLSRSSTSGPNSAAVRESLSWGYRRVTERVYGADGETVVNEFCFDTVSLVTC